METGIPHYIDTPRGTLVFNDFNNPTGTFRTQAIENADGGNMRVDVEDVPQRDGARVGDGFEGAMYPIFRVVIDPKGDLTRRRVMEDELKGKLASIKRADGTWRYTPRGTTDRRITVRLFEKVMIAGGPIVKEATFALVAGDPTQYADAEETVQSSPLALGTTTGAWSLGPANLLLPAGITPDFEDALTGWSLGAFGGAAGSLTRSSAFAKHGLWSALLAVTTAGDINARTTAGAVPVKASTPHVLSAWVKAPVGCFTRLRVVGTGGDRMSTDTNGTGAFQRLTFPFTTAAGETALELRLQASTGAGGQSIYWDSVVLEEVETVGPESDGRGGWSLSSGGVWTLGSGAPGGVAGVVNDGNGSSYPIIRIYGQVDAPIVRNETTGREVALPGLSLSTGAFAELDMRRETVTLNGIEGQTLLGTVDPDAEFFALEPGPNTITLQGSNYDGVARLDVIFRDAWE